MRRYSLIALAGMAALVLPVGPAVPQAPGGTVLLPQQYRMLDFEQGSFVKRRRAYSANVAAARRSEPPDEDGTIPQGAAEVRAVLELAEFDLAHGLAAEGLDVLAGLEHTPLRSHALKRAALELAAIDTRERPMSEEAEALLDPKYALWRDQAVLLALHHWKRGEMAEAGQYVDVSAKRLYQYSRPFVRKVLPVLLDIAVETGQWPAARRLAGRVTLDKGLAASPAYKFQIGRTAEAGGDYLMAFDNYLEAGQGNDIWAQKARMALVRMGLETRTLPVPDARVLLDKISRDWAGDALAVAVLTQLAEMDLKLGDPLAALNDLARIIVGYPDSAHAQLARQQARSLWKQFYARGAAGAMGLSEYLMGHRRIAEAYRFEPGFDAETEALADHFLAAGATMVAADEYRETHDFLLVTRDLGLVEADDRRLDELRLKQAEALYKGGQLDELAYVLAEGLRSDDTALNDRLTLLKARMYADRGEDVAVMQTAVSEPTAHYLRIQAAAHFGRKDWEEAARLYGTILEMDGAEARDSDAIHLLLAAHRSGDRETALEVAQRFEAITESPQWARIAQSLNELPPDLLPLRADTAQERVEQAGTTLENLRDLQAGN